MYADVELLLLAGLTCIGTPQVGHGWGAGGLTAGLTGGAGASSFPLEDTVAVHSFDSGRSIRLDFSRIGLLCLPVIRELGISCNIPLTEYYTNLPSTLISFPQRALRARTRQCTRKARMTESTRRSCTISALRSLCGTSSTTLTLGIEGCHFENVT
jgi:hypothetical protein